MKNGDKPTDVYNLPPLEREFAYQAARWYMQGDITWRGGK